MERVANEIKYTTLEEEVVQDTLYSSYGFTLKSARPG